MWSNSVGNLRAYYVHPKLFWNFLSIWRIWSIPFQNNAGNKDHPLTAGREQCTKLSLTIVCNKIGTNFAIWKHLRMLEKFNAPLPTIHFWNVLVNLVARMWSNIWLQAKRMSSFVENVRFLNCSFNFGNTIGRMWQYLDLYGC